MYELTFALLLITGIILLILGLSLEGEHDYWHLLSIGLSMIIFLSLSAAVMDIEIPYQMINQSTGNIETGFQVHGYDYSLSYLFLGIAVFECIYMLIFMFEHVGIISTNLWKNKNTYRRY